jgi:anti-sigma regulatory factor (Ser/Thr protein kinase)
MRLARKAVVAVVAASGSDAAALADVEIAVGEALANAHRHAYGGAPGRIEIDVAGRRITDQAIVWTVSVHDHGTAVTPPPVPEALSRGTVGQRGLYLISRLMDRVTIIVNPSTGYGVSITMEKTLTLV